MKNICSHFAQRPTLSLYKLCLLLMKPNEAIVVFAPPHYVLVGRDSEKVDRLTETLKRFLHDRAVSFVRAGHGHLAATSCSSSGCLGALDGISQGLLARLCFSRGPSGLLPALSFRLCQAVTQAGVRLSTRSCRCARHRMHSSSLVSGGCSDARAQLLLPVVF